MFVQSFTSLLWVNADIEKTVLAYTSSRPRMDHNVYSETYLSFVEYYTGTDASSHLDPLRTYLQYDAPTP